MAEHELNKIVDDDGEVFNLRDSTKQPTADRVTAWGSTPSDTKYPSEKLVKNALDGKLPLYKLGSEVPSSQDFVCLRIKANYVSGVNKSQVLLFDITSFADGSIVNDDGAYVGFKGFFIGGKPQGGGEAVCVKICAKIAYTQITTTMGYNTLKSDSIDCGPEVIKRTENGVDKYYLSIFYGATVYSGNCILVGQFLWRKPTSIDDYSYKNGLICEYTPNETYPAGEPYWNRLHTFTSNIHANTSTKLATARKLKTNLERTADSTFDGSADQTNIPVTGTLPVANGGTGKTTAKAAEYNLTTGKSEISDTTSGDDRVVFELASPSESNGVTRGFRKLSTVWTWVKGLLSSESGVNISGNAATATAAQSGSALETAINGKMNTSASNATAPSGSGGDGATATLLNNLTDGNSEIVTTDDGDNVLIATTDNGGTVTNKWYKRKLVKLIPWIIKKLGTRLVYDCGAGSTSGDDFDAALAAFNAGQWVIIRKDGIAYYCVGSYSGPGLRFKQIANDGRLLKVNTISWTRGSSPSAVTQTEASLSGHTHTRSDITNFGHTHGNIQDSGALQTSDVTIASGDKLVITDSSNDGKVARASASFDGSTTTKALTQKGTFETFMTPSAGNAASGALQNLTGQLTEGTSDFTDNTEIFTSYAGNSGFAESGHVNQPYRRKASSMLNYVRDWFAIDRSPANVGTTHKRISLGYGKYSSSNYVGAMTYIVRLFFNYADDGGLQGKGITVLVTYDFRRSGAQKSECRILSDNGVRDAGYNVVLANYVSGSGDNGKLYICIGLVKNSAPTTLVEFNYSYCKIFRVSTVGDWVEDISSDAVGTYNYIIQATDLVSAAVNADMVDGKHIVIGSWAGASNTIYFG